MNSIKFEIINGILCRMVEPTFLTPESQFPCVVRLIQDDSPMGRYNQSYSEYRYGVKLGCCMLPIIATHIAKNGVVNDVEWDVNRYEIIGYPVEDGSAEWALWQRQNKRSVITDTGVVMRYHYDDETCNALLRVYPTGWQLYTEPQTEPCEICDGIGMISCEACNATGRVPIEPDPRPAYAVGDWVEFNPGSNPHQVRIVKVDGEKLHYIDEKGYQTHIYISAITRKLKPSDVVVHIGCLSGTVEKASDFDLFLLWHSKKDCDYSMIRFDALDEPTAKLVRELLEKQKGETQ